MTEKENLLKYIDAPVLINARNIMGCSENWYDPYFAIMMTFSKEEIIAMPDDVLDDLIKLAKNISDGLY